jgi:carbon monoxide dehydrogenase subunit G
MRVQTSTKLPAPPEEVWDVVMDPSRLAEWVTIHRALEDCARGRLEKGSSFRQTLQLAGRPFKVTWTVADEHRPRTAVWEGKGPVGSCARIRYGLDRVNGGTRFTYENSFELPGGLLGRFAGRVLGRAMVKREIERSLDNLRRLFQLPTEAPAVDTRA